MMESSAAATVARWLKIADSASPALIHRAPLVERSLERERLRAPPFHELADLAAQARHRLELLRVGLAPLGGEELHRADDPAGAADREAGGGVHAGQRGATCSRKVVVVRELD